MPGMHSFSAGGYPSIGGGGGGGSRRERRRQKDTWDEEAKCVFKCAVLTEPKLNRRCVGDCV